MCYVCMQRAQRNVPMYLAEERKRKEKEEERILAQYLTMKDQDALRKQQVLPLGNSRATGNKLFFERGNCLFTLDRSTDASPALDGCRMK